MLAAVDRQNLPADRWGETLVAPSAEERIPSKTVMRLFFIQAGFIQRKPARASCDRAGRSLILVGNKKRRAANNPRKQPKLCFDGLEAYVIMASVGLRCVQKDRLIYLGLLPVGMVGVDLH